MKVQQILLSIAIALIFALFVGYGIEVFDPSPKHEAFCPPLYEINNSEECILAEGIWPEPEAETLSGQGSQGIKHPTSARGYCNNKAACYDDFNVARSQHDKIVFIIAAIIGILAVIAGITIQKEGVNSGFISGGIILILYGTIRYWQYANNLLKFILLGIVLGILIWLAYKRLGRK